MKTFIQRLKIALPLIGFALLVGSAVSIAIDTHTIATPEESCPEMVPYQYQVTLVDSFYVIEQNGRPVGTINYVGARPNAWDSLFIKDNE